LARTVNKIKKEKLVQYIGTGRRKTAIARVFLKSGNGVVTVNGKEPQLHLGEVQSYLNLLKKPLQATSTEGKYDITAQVHGGGLSGQADAIRLGIARALISINPDFKALLKAEGLLTRDPREKERKKYGRAKARARFQHSKR
jgi:small subunit ribosomal protein S9